MIYDRSANPEARIASALTLLEIKDRQILDLTNRLANLRELLDHDQKYIRAAKEASDNAYQALSKLHRPTGYF